jgi:hypothetical protein
MSPVLTLHIFSGTLGLLSGAAAVSFRKGSRRHAFAGNIFVVAMLGLGASAMYLAVQKSQVGNLLGGMMTLYLIITAWLTVRRKAGESGTADWAAMAVPVIVGIANVSSGIQRIAHPEAFHDGVPVFMNFFMATIVLLAAAGDVRMLTRGLSATQRIARHLWRMCFGLFIATGSIFIARPHLFPVFMRKSGILILLGVAPLLLLIFWMVRVRFTNLGKPVPRAASPRQPLLSSS